MKNRLVLWSLSIFVVGIGAMSSPGNVVAGQETCVLWDDFGSGPDCPEPQPSEELCGTCRYMCDWLEDDDDPTWWCYLGDTADHCVYGEWGCSTTFVPDWDCPAGLMVSENQCVNQPG